MPSHVLVDLVALALIFGFAAKGYMLGIVRSVASLVAVAASWAAAKLFPMASMPLLLFFGEWGPLTGPWAAKMTTFVLAFLAIQVGAFFLTGLFEKVGLGLTNRVLGALLGVTTGVLVGCLPLAAVQAMPALHRSQVVQGIAKRSLAWRQYAPMVARVVGPPARR